MTLVRLNPTRNFFPSINNFDQLLGSFFESNTDYSAAWAPVVDLSESKEGYELTAEIPGMKKEDITVSLKDNILTVSGEKKVEKKEESKKIFRSERSYGKFERSFKLIEEVKSDSIKANYSDGILRVTIPKDEEKILPKMIKIN